MYKPGDRSKNRSVCENAVTGLWDSCTLQVVGPCIHFVHTGNLHPSNSGICILVTKQMAALEVSPLLLPVLYSERHIVSFSALQQVRCKHIESGPLLLLSIL